METLRLVRRLILFGGLTLLGFLFVLATTPVVRALSGATSRWRARVVGRWARMALPLIGARVSVTGTPPSPPFFLVSNHLSYVDVLVLASQAPCLFVAKSEIARWPFFGLLAQAASTIFIDRDNRRDIPGLLDRIEREVRSGVGVVVFPEATSSRGAEVLPFRPALLEVPARAGAAVSYAAITYATAPGGPPAQRAVCWWDDTTFTAHFLRLFAIPGFEARIAFGGPPIRGEDRKQLASKLRDAVGDLFEPVV